MDANAFVISTSVFCVVATLANLFLMISILASPSLRTCSKHILIFTLCLTDFCSGVFVLPLTAEFYSLERWTHDPNILKALDMSGYLLDSLRISLIIFICVDAIVNILTHNKRLSILLSVNMIIASLLFSLVNVLAMYESQPIPDLIDICSWSVLYSKQTSLFIVTFFPQTLVIIVLVLDIFIISSCSSIAVQGCSGEAHRVPTDVASACFLMLIYITPFMIYHGYFSSCRGQGDSQGMHIAAGVTEHWERVRPCVMPFVWLLSPETWRGFKQVHCCRRSEIRECID